MSSGLLFSLLLFGICSGIIGDIGDVSLLTKFWAGVPKGMEDVGGLSIWIFELTLDVIFSWFIWFVLFDKDLK